MFYYLDSTRTPCGPHRQEELFGMLQSGTLKPDTPVAKDGGEAWHTLWELFMQQASIRPCPICGSGIISAPGSIPAPLPLHCPHCGHQIRPMHPQSIISNLSYTLSHPFRFKGRATRREFWSAALCFIAAGPIALIIIEFVYDSLALRTPEIANYTILLLAIAGGIGGIIMAALSTRRLRDAGMSTKLPWGLLCYPLCLILILIAENTYITRLDSSYKILTCAAGTLFYLAFVCSVIIMVLSLAKSKKIG